MLHDLRLPRLNPHMQAAVVECVYVHPGAVLKAGDKLFDLSVDLGSAYSQDCPPISYYRVVLREKLWLRALRVAAGARCGVDQDIALFSTDADEPAEGPCARQVRIATAGIIAHAAMWSHGVR